MTDQTTQLREPATPHHRAGDALSEAMQDTFVSREPEMARRQLAQLWRSLRERGFTVASFTDLKETGTEHWNVPCNHGMAAHTDDGCVECECTTPGLRHRVFSEQSAAAGGGPGSPADTSSSATPGGPDA